MLSALRRFDWTQWLRVARPSHSAAVLSRRHIYILPTQHGLLFVTLLLAMLVGSINYTLSLGFVLAFLLAGMGVVAMLHTWRNLAHLRVECGRIDPVFAGEEAIIEIIVSDDQRRQRFAIAARFDDGELTYADVAAVDHASFKLRLATKSRGWLKPGRITFSTEFPLTLFYAWAYVNLDCRCLVYPRPAAAGLVVPGAADEGTTGLLDARSGDDDFAGHRQYQFGDSPRRVDWKASSREQGLLTKQFQGEAQSALWLDWATTPGVDIEQRIRQLTRWVVDAHAHRQSYGLRLPGLEYPPSIGEVHYHQCLQALALLEIA